MLAIYHLAVKSVSRSTGRSAVAASAYRAGELLENERDGMVHDYTKRGGVEDKMLVVPEGAEWALDRSALWNAAELAEKRKDAKVAREYELALPAELDRDQRRELVRGFAEELRDRYGVAVDACLHAPHDHGDDRNHHAHVMTTTRVVGPDGLGAKTRQLDVSSTASLEIEAVRASWAKRVNQALDRAQVQERVDHRSYARQGKAIEPTIKLGHAAAALERREQRRAAYQGRDYEPVTLRGMFNAVVEEGRKLSVYVERGREWLREVAARARATIAPSPSLDIAGLARAAGQTMRQADQQPAPGLAPRTQGQTRDGPEIKPPRDRHRGPNR